MQSTPSTAPTSQTVSTDECDELMAIASSDLYRQNAFRVLGIGVSATLRDATKQVERRRILAELGQSEGGSPGRLELRPAPSIDDLRAAEAVVHDPVQRLVHELFWFWPLDANAAEPDMAIKAIQAGDLKTASKMWEAAKAAASTTSPQVAIAKHNMAVRWHLMALDLEGKSKGECWRSDDKELAQKTWRIALAYWNDSVRSDATWNALSARAIALNDDRLSLEFVQSMRRTIGRALLKINASLAIRYADSTIIPGAEAHATLLLESSLPSATPLVVDEYLIAPIKVRIRQCIADAEKSRSTEPAHGDAQTRQLLVTFSRFDCISSKLNASTRNRDFDGLADEVATQCFANILAFHSVKNDDVTATALLERVLPLARSDDLRARIAANIETGKGNQLWTTLDPLVKALTTVEESKSPPKERLSAFLGSVYPQIDAMASALAQSSNVRNTLYDRIARLLRDISVDAWNLATDGKTALDAMGRADHYAISAEVKSRLAEDRVTLTRVYAEKRRELQTAKNKKYTWGVGIAAIVAFIIWANSNDEPSPRPAPNSTPSPAASLTSVGSSVSGQPDLDKTYHIPSYKSAELARDRASAEASQAQQNQLEAQLNAAQQALDARRQAAQSAQDELDRLGTNIEQERPLVSQEDESALQRFNAEVAKYNRLASKARHLMAESNELVDPYNALLARVRQQTAQTNSLIDAYNKKLEQYGH
jgi:hypothetical protein